MFKDVNEANIEPDDTSKTEYHFFYNREERLKHAPKIVQDFYAGNNKPVKGIRVLFTKQNRYILLALIFFVAVAWIYSGMNSTRKYSKVNDLDAELTAFSYEDQIYTSLSIKRNVKSKSTEAEKVVVEFFLINADKQIVGKEVQSIVYEDGEQFIRSKSTDYEIIRVDAIVTVNNIEKEISCPVKR